MGGVRGRRQKKENPESRQNAEANTSASRGGLDQGRRRKNGTNCLPILRPTPTISPKEEPLPLCYAETLCFTTCAAKMAAFPGGAPGGRALPGLPHAETGEGGVGNSGQQADRIKVRSAFSRSHESNLSTDHPAQQERWEIIPITLSMSFRTILYALSRLLIRKRRQYRRAAVEDIEPGRGEVARVPRVGHGARVIDPIEHMQNSAIGLRQMLPWQTNRMRVMESSDSARSRRRAKSG